MITITWRILWICVDTGGVDWCDVDPLQPARTAATTAAPMIEATHRPPRNVRFLPL